MTVSRSHARASARAEGEARSLVWRRALRVIRAANLAETRRKGEARTTERERERERERGRGEKGRKRKREREKERVDPARVKRDRVIQ
jgi:hypothetical protein